MNIKYFRDTDTSLLEFSDHRVSETKEIGENIYIDLDEAGHLISMTIEHAKRRTILPEVVVQEFDKGAA